MRELSKTSIKSVMHFLRALFSIGFLGAVFLMADVASAERTERFNLSPDLRLNLGDDVAQPQPQVSITNDISVSANSGGNSASGKNGQPGGSVTTGSAKAEVKVETVVNGETIVDINESYEGEVEIEKDFENASGTVQTKIKVEVNSGMTTATTSAVAREVVKRAEKRIEKEVWFLRMWPFGRDDKKSEAREERGNNMTGTSSAKVEIVAVSGATSTASTSSPQATGRHAREKIKSFFRNLFSIFGF